MTDDGQRPPLFDARGNRYIVVSPKDVVGLEGLVENPAAAAARHSEWAAGAIAMFCQVENPEGEPSIASEKPYWSDGLLVGPFPGEEGAGLIIVNTDGTIAERSGNGLTIFAHFLIDRDYVDADASFDVAVFHHNSDANRLIATCRSADLNEVAGVWVDMGVPAFGPSSVGALAAGLEASPSRRTGTVCVRPLRRLDSTWTTSVFVNVGNPHCVTFVANDLPTMEQLHDATLLRPLEVIANSTHSKERPGKGEVCEFGVNLQWAKVVGDGEVEARVFERGEGPTLSSGSSAVAVASASKHLGLVDTSQVLVKMPGGDAPIHFGDDGRVFLFGQASKVPYE